MEKVKREFSRIREKHVGLRTELRERTTGYILAAFGFVASLAWNEAIKSFIDQFFPGAKNSVLIKFMYALVVTVVVVVITVYVIKLNEKKEK